MLHIWDLDGTVLDSSHRLAAKSDGTLDLDHWIASNTPENCAKDSLLPLVDMMRKTWANGHTVLVCTARVLSDWDFEFFMENNIPYHEMLSRPEGCTFPDTDLKELQLRLYAQRNQISWRKFCDTALIWDDCEAVRLRMANIGVDSIDAKRWNRRVLETGAVRVAI